LRVESFLMKHKKRKKRVRTRDWTEGHEYSFTHDRAVHRRADTVPDSILDKGFQPTTTDPNATVISHSGQWAFVKMHDGARRTSVIDDKLIEGKASLLAPGDEVRVEGDGADWFLRGIAERRTKLSRLALDQARVSEQLIAVNVDLLVVVASARHPRFKPGLVDRYLIAAYVGGVEPILCLNKMDLVKAEPAEAALYRDIGLPVFATSCETGQGLNALRVALRGQLSVFAGHSGTGKSSLLNAMDPALDIEVQKVSDLNEKGRHTTTASTLYELAEGIRIIDTPGARKLGVWGVSPQELAFYFPEMERLAPDCHFRDCTHTHEPDCAVLRAVETGEIPRLRYDSYLRIRDSL